MDKKQLMGNVYVIFIDGLTKKIDSEPVGFPKRRSELERDFRSLDDGKLFRYMYFDQSSCMFVLRILNPDSGRYNVVTAASFELLTSYIYKLIIVECGGKYKGGSILYNDIMRYGIMPISDFTSVNERSWTSISGKSISTNELRSVVMMSNDIDSRYFLEILLGNIFNVFKPFYQIIGDPSADYNMDTITSYGAETRHIIISDNMETCKQLYGYLNYRFLTDIDSVDIVIGFLDMESPASIGKDEDKGSVYLKILADGQGSTKDIGLFIDHKGDHVISRYIDSTINRKVAVLHVLSPVKVFTDIGMPMVSYRSTGIHDMIEYINLQHEIRG